MFARWRFTPWKRGLYDNSNEIQEERERLRTALFVRIYGPASVGFLVRQTRGGESFHQSSNEFMSTELFAVRGNRGVLESVTKIGGCVVIYSQRGEGA